jgi:hypothetical protein
MNINNNLNNNIFNGIYFTDEQLEEIRNSIKDNIYPIVYIYDVNNIFQEEYEAPNDPMGSAIMRI